MEISCHKVHLYLTTHDPVVAPVAPVLRKDSSAEPNAEDSGLQEYIHHGQANKSGDNHVPGIDHSLPFTSFSPIVSISKSAHLTAHQQLLLKLVAATTADAATGGRKRILNSDRPPPCSVQQQHWSGG